MSIARIGLLGLLISAGACHEEMTRAETIKAVEECRRAGLETRVLVYAFDEKIARVQCVPKL